MRKTKTLAAMLFAVLLLGTLLGGCATPGTASSNPTVGAVTDKPSSGATVAASAEPAAELPEVELAYYFPNSPQKDLLTVNDQVSKLVKAKINATVKLNLVVWDKYSENVNVVLGSGEACDLLWDDASTIYQHIAKGMLEPLNGLVDQYAPAVKTIVPEVFWQSVTVKGSIYAVPNFQQATPAYGFIIRKDIADKYSIDWKSVKKLSELEPILALVKEKEPTLVPWTGDMFNLGAPMFGMQPVSGIMTPGWVYLGDKDLKVVNQYDTPEFKEYIKMMRDWYQKGYMRADIATLADQNEDLKAGKQALAIGQIDLDSEDYAKAGLEFTGRMSSHNADVQSYDKRLSEPLLTTDKAAATNTAIPVTSKNKERAMMLINLLNTDSAIYNTMVWGVQDKHYKLITPQSDTNSGRIETIKDGGYSTFCYWEFGTMLNMYLGDDGPIGGEANYKFRDMWADMNRNAKAADTLGFVFDTTPVKTEVASCKTVWDQMYKAIAFGTVDPDTYQPQFISKLKEAGSDAILTEMQKQLDAWKASK